MTTIKTQPKAKPKVKKKRTRLVRKGDEYKHRGVFRDNKSLRKYFKKGPGVKKADCVMVEVIEQEYLVPETGKPLALEDHQRRILNHFFTPINGRLRYNTFVYSCPKKSGKTEVAGAIMYAWAKCYGGDCYSIANDLAQAQERAFTRVVGSLKTLKREHEDRYTEEVAPDYHKVTAKRDRDGNTQLHMANGARILAIPCDPYGEAGGMQSLTVWDELWGYRHENAWKLWTEMQPLPRGVGGLTESIRFIVTYAGWYGESELLWNVYEEIVQPDENGNPTGERVRHMEDLPLYVKDKTCVYWDHEARMPWHTPEFMEQAKSDPALKGRASEYLRIWENRWTTGLESYIDMELYDQLVARGEAEGLTNRMEGLLV